MHNTKKEQKMKRYQKGEVMLVMMVVMPSAIT